MTSICAGRASILKLKNLRPPTGYVLLFEDDFPGSSLDATKWGINTEGTSDPSRVTVENGRLILRATGTAPGDHLTAAVRPSDSYYLSTWQGTIGLVNMFRTPGWLEIIMKPSEIVGVMSELVIWTDAYELAAGSLNFQFGEIDIVEARAYLPGNMRPASHAWTAPNWVQPYTDRAQNTSPFFGTNRFHRFVAHWDDAFVKIYCDNRLIHQRDLSADPFPVFGFLSTVVMTCWIGAVGDGWAGAGGVAYPIDTQMEVESVKFYSDPTLIASETTTLLAAMSVAPDQTRKLLIDNVITALVKSGIWAKLDCLWVLAAHDSQAARLNWKNPAANTLTVGGGAPTFLADRHYATDGVDDWLDTNFNPATAGGNFAQNSACLGIWNRLAVNSDTSAAGWFDGTDGVTMVFRTSGNSLGARLNATTSVFGGVAGADGFSVANRTSSTTVTLYKSATQVGTSAANTSTALNSANLRLGSVTAASFAAAQFAAVVVGRHLTVPEQTVLYYALRGYMQGVGSV